MTQQEQIKNTFPKLAEAIRYEYEKRKVARVHYITRGYMPSWSAEHCTDPERGLKEYSTANKWNAYKNGAITREQAESYAITRALKELDKLEAKELDKLATVAAAPAAEWFTIGVHWTRSKMWGYNPTATVTAQNDTTEGHASGCGYDKESAAVAHALNENPSILRILYDAAEKALKDGATLPTTSDKYRLILGYGCGYDILPYFEGGCGCSCYRSTLEKLGYKWRTGRSTDTFNGYTISKEA